MQQNVAIIGAGNVGSAIGIRLSEQGCHVVFGVRNPGDSKYDSLIEKCNGNASCVNVSNAAQDANIILLCTPWSATHEAITSLGAIDGKVLIDCTNPLKADLSGLLDTESGSGGEDVALWAGKADVFKAFNTTGYNIMLNPVVNDQRACMFFCGNGSDIARDAVKQLIDALGFESVDVGDISSSSLLENMALLWIQSAYKHGMGRDFAFSIMRFEQATNT
ncbi:MAG: NAD(P)-binding domain-containing protein [Sphaerospermopsis sp. SIO1G2]|nr:NAD(P)-binding domain-containing protein [Sphaerospermopsis sp. SIO1G2]